MMQHVRVRDRRLVHSRLQYRQPRIVPGSEATTGTNLRDEGDVVDRRCERMAGSTTQTIRAYGCRRQQVRVESRCDGNYAQCGNVGAVEASRRTAKLRLSRGVGKAQHQRGRNIPQAVYVGQTTYWNDTVATSQGVCRSTLNAKCQASKSSVFTS